MSEAIASKAERLAAYNANIAAAEKDPSLSPETGKPLSKMNAARPPYPVDPLRSRARWRHPVPDRHHA